MPNVQRWTGPVAAFDGGGFVCYGDYLTLEKQLAAAQAREAELVAHVGRLRSYLVHILEYWTQDGNSQELFDVLCHIEETVKAELAATPAQSFAAITKGEK